MSVYIDCISDDDAGFISVDLGGSGYELEPGDGVANIINEFSIIYGVGYDDDKPRIISASLLQGIFSVPSEACILLEFSDDEFIRIGCIGVHSVAGEDGISLLFADQLNIPKRYLCIMSRDINNIKKTSSISLSKVESTKTSNRKGEIIPALLKMIPEFSGVDIDNEKASKISDILSALAANKKIELNMPDKNTWIRYLGRNIGRG